MGPERFTRLRNSNVLRLPMCDVGTLTFGDLNASSLNQSYPCRNNNRVIYRKGIKLFCKSAHKSSNLCINIKSKIYLVIRILHTAHSAGYKQFRLDFSLLNTK